MAPKSKKDNRKNKSAKDKVKDNDNALSIASEDSGVEVLTDELSELAIQNSGKAPSDINRRYSNRPWIYTEGQIWLFGILSQQVLVAHEV